jgi:O-antigen/teichoic acid export membrane protein
VTDKTYYGTIISVSAAIITIVLNYALIPIYGYDGSAVTTLIVYVFMCAFAYFTGMKHYPVNYDVKRLLLYMLLMLLLLTLGWQIDMRNIFITQLIREALILGFVGIAYLIERKRLNPV